MLSHGRLHRRQFGLSLIELMVGIAVGLVVLASMTVLLVNNVKASKEAVQSARLNQQLRAALDLIASDVRRANYGSTANTITLSSNQLVTKYSNHTRTVTLSDGAILYTDDVDGISEKLTDPSLITVTSLQFCFVNTKETAAADDSCSTTLPSADSVAVTGTSKTIKVQGIRISVTGRLVADSAISKSLTTTVRVRNDAFD